jgi:hypothetical protein
MIKLPVDADDVLKNMAAEAVRQGKDMRVAVRELTLNALRSRELSLAQMKQVLKKIAEGVSMGSADPKVNVEQTFKSAIAGMDDALLKAVEANQMALQQLASQGQSLRESHLKKALTDLERLEDSLLKAVKEAAAKSDDQLKQQWMGVLQQKQEVGTEAGAKVKTMMEKFSEETQQAVRSQRRMTLKAAHVLSENFTTLASGILIGLSEGLQKGRSSKRKGRK